MEKRERGNKGNGRNRFYFKVQDLFVIISVKLLYFCILSIMQCVLIIFTDAFL